MVITDTVSGANESGFLKILNLTSKIPNTFSTKEPDNFWLNIQCNDPDT